ncbi:MAG: ATP-binding protein [Candidatus Dormibacteraeota bacterium]|nr:ATP-binding protein [Candidatus Dormibacteraeota bacterium]
MIKSGATPDQSEIQAGRGAQLRSWWPAVLLLLSTAAYIGVYIVVEPFTGRSAGALIAIPVIVSAWFYGWPGAVMAMVVFLPITATLVHVAHPDQKVAQAFSLADAPGIAVAWVTGVVVGRWRDVERLRRGELRARIAAEAESRAMNRFLATMNHELRTPLNSILGFSQLLAHQGAQRLDEKQLRQLGHIQSSGFHMLGLIGDILDLSKIAGGQMEVQIALLELAPLLDESVAKVRPLAEEKGLSLTLDPSPEMWVEADRRRLFQVLLNLLSNAVKFTPPGGEIRMTLRRTEDIAEISVSDTGIGIEPEDQERIFDEFVQIDSHSDARTQGSGLGLTMSRRLLALMGGSIRVYSVPDEGSVFTVAFPIPRSRSLVVVDPDGNLAERLERSTYSLYTADNVEEAAELAARHRPAAVVLAESIDDADEAWIRKALKGRQASAAIPVLARAADQVGLLREIVQTIRPD